MKHSIITVITDADLVRFQQKKAEYLEKHHAADEIMHRVGVNAVPVPTQQGLQIQFIPYMITERACTEEQYNDWKRGNTIII